MVYIRACSPTGGSDECNSCVRAQCQAMALYSLIVLMCR